MKRVKIMFTAIAVLAVVGGALAFKAHTYSSLTVYQKVAATCPSITTSLYEFSNPNVPAENLIIADATFVVGGTATTVDPISCTGVTVKGE